MKLPILALIISIVALIITALTPYYTFLKAFSIKCNVDHEIGLQWAATKIVPKTKEIIEGNLGIYLEIDLQNASPKTGSISDMALIIYREVNPTDKYFLEFASFRVLDTSGLIYVDSEEKLPLLLKPWDRESKLIKFVYNVDEQFPITQGTYTIELLIFLETKKQAAVSKIFKIDLSKDLVDNYVTRRSQKTSSLEKINIVGFTPAKSGKISEEQYKLLK